MIRYYGMHKMPPPPQALTNQFPHARQLDADWMIYSGLEKNEKSYKVNMIDYMAEQQALDPNLDYDQVFYDEMDTQIVLPQNKTFLFDLYQAQLWVKTFEVLP